MRDEATRRGYWFDEGARIVSAEPPAPHALFVVVPGDVASWERAS
ncbi:hypothetical protein [Promicromonospora soli]